MKKVSYLIDSSPQLGSEALAPVRRADVKVLHVHPPLTPLRVVFGEEERVAHQAATFAAGFGDRASVERPRPETVQLQGCRIDPNYSFTNYLQ